MDGGAQLPPALPVIVEVADPAGQRLRALLEGTLGWQVVDRDTSLVVPPVCAFVDLEAPDDPGVPTLLVVREGDPPGGVAESVLARRPSGVVAWPADSGRIAELVAGILGSAPTGTDPRQELRVGGAAGGVGTTTVALAAGALLAWAHGPVLALTHGHVPVPGVRTLTVEDLAGSGTWRAATAAPGCRGLRVLRTATPPSDAPVDPGPATVVVRDIGVSSDTDVLVLRRDGAGLDALRRTTAGVIVVCDHGVVPLPTIVRAAESRRTVVLPWSVRVGRAGSLGRVPGSLPGSWLRRLVAPLNGVPSTAVGGGDRVLTASRT